MAVTHAVTEIAALEEAYDECTRAQGAPTVAQMKLVREAELLYVQREGIEVVFDVQEEPALTPTDIADGG